MGEGSADEDSFDACDKYIQRYQNNKGKTQYPLVLEEMEEKCLQA